jgi:hypothetical protein
MFKHLSIDPNKNLLLCSTDLVGVGERVELHAPGGTGATPIQIAGKIMKKVADPNLFEVETSYDSQEFVGKRYYVEQDCVFRVLTKSIGGTRRRKFAKDEKEIVNLENNDDFIEKKVVKAKTGSVRKKRKKAQ